MHFTVRRTRYKDQWTAVQGMNLVFSWSWNRGWQAFLDTWKYASSLQWNIVNKFWQSTNPMQCLSLKLKLGIMLRISLSEKSQVMNSQNMQHKLDKNCLYYVSCVLADLHLAANSHHFESLNALFGICLVLSWHMPHIHPADHIRLKTYPVLRSMPIKNLQSDVFNIGSLSCRHLLQLNLIASSRICSNSAASSNTLDQQSRKPGNQVLFWLSVQQASKESRIFKSLRG